MDTRAKRESRKNPQETSNVLSLLFFGWTAQIFWKGARRDLKVTDLYDPLKLDESERLGDRLEKEWDKELKRADEELALEEYGKKAKTRRPSLTRAIIRMFWFSYLMEGLLLLFQSVVLRVMQPILQGWIIDYFDPGQTEMTKNQVLMNAGYMVVVNLGLVFITHHSLLRTRRIGMCIRVAVCSLIYRKVLRIDQGQLNNQAAGRVANLISNDVARFDTVPMFLHHIWIMPIQVLLIGYVMWQSVGIASVVGVAAMLLQTIPVQVFLISLTAKLRSQIAVKTDNRIQLLSEIISGVQVVKMYAWEKPFELIVSKVRELEIRLVGQMSYIRGFNNSMNVLSGKIALYFTLICFVLMGNPLTAEITFVLESLFNAMKFTCAIFFPEAMVMAGEASASSQRITDFLLSDEVKRVKDTVPAAHDGLNDQKKTGEDKKINGIRIGLTKVSANWIHGYLPPTLCDISMEVTSGSLCAVVGPVASGKSSLLHLLLGELPVGAGRLTLLTGDNNATEITSRDIRISYASQDPWIFSASIRDNILFGQPYENKRYQEVTRVCALLRDFEQLPQGDLSFVGERGASLSGGQRARVNLARAVYRDADLYLLDDPLSAVDAHVSRHLFEECINGYLKDKTRILVTHQLQYLRQANTVVVLNNGKLERQSTYDELVKSNFHILKSEVTEGLDEIEQQREGPNEDSPTHESAVTQSLSVDNDESKVPSKQEAKEGVSEEVIGSGQMSNKVYWGYFLAGGNICSLLFLAIIFITGQVAFSGTDYWVTYWSNQETIRVELQSMNSDYRHNGTQESEWFDEFGLFSPRLAIYVYTFCILGSTFFVLLRSILFMRTCMISSRNIHASMLSNLLQATMRFFNTNPSGRVLNRFSKDLGTMDELLPRTMLDTLQILYVVIGIFVMVAISNYWMILPGLVMGWIIFTVRKYYLKTAQSVQRLEGIAKSPVFSHVNSTLDGLTTIRSRGAEAEGLLRREFDIHQDAHSGAWYLALGITSAFGLFLDIMSCTFITCVCFLLILMDNGDTLPGSVGLAISQSLMLINIVQYGVRMSTEVITQMTSVERVLQYTDLPKEGPFTSENPPSSSWPSKGALTFKNVTMAYAENKPPVLKNMNVSINSGWKVGIVGRTGAGKSSLISALFRLSGNGLEGEIALDGIDTKSIGLHELRPKISIIPQEPILFSASLRYNLDPFEQYSDAELWDSLREVELSDAVPSLDFQVAGGGANFSVGQRQLICLARAILRNNRILVLDEATANVDQRTDTLIQATIRRRFADCTVLTIAHRLNTIMDSDRVLVMSEGRIGEFGHPHLLLQNKSGLFHEMLQQTGNTSAEKLTRIAEGAHVKASGLAEKLNECTQVTNL